VIPAAEGVTPDSIARYVEEQWPDAPMADCHEVSGRHAFVSRVVDEASIRPGGFISGPTQFSIADLALWYACFGAIGLEAMALTSELSIRFVRPALGRALNARADLHSVGARNVVGTVTIWTDDESRPVSVCQGTYVLPRVAESTEAVPTGAVPTEAEGTA
jgi:acyl-coenzyme A thioesterase PaaI-like protein